jgi:GNAT superfamily N-acetyltransferase
MSAGPSLHVRPARPEDDSAIGELLVEGYLTAYARKMPEVVLSERRLAYLRDVASKRSIASVLVGELEGRVVGTVALFPPGATGSEAWLPNAADLRQLVTHPSVHGRGFSKPLLDAAERLAFETWRVAAICLHVRRGNRGVARLYQGRGYVRAPEGDLDTAEVFLEAYVLRAAG